MGSGFHSRCSLTGSCSDYENNHYYYKSGVCISGRALRSVPTRWLGASCPQICRGWGWPQMEPWGVWDALVRGRWAGWPGDALSPKLKGSSVHTTSCGHAGAPAGPWDEGDEHLSERGDVSTASLLSQNPADAGPAAGPLLRCGHACSGLLQGFTSPSWPEMLDLSPWGASLGARAELAALSGQSDTGPPS